MEEKEEFRAAKIQSKRLRADPDAEEIPSALTIIFRILTFQFSLGDLQNLNHRHFLIGLFGTWIVGMGRYWDDPGAHLLQHLGLGSVIYIFVLTAFLFPFIWGMGTTYVTLLRLLTFISLTSFPAILYAIPIEHYVSIENATTINAWFLAIVALWRCALLIRFLSITGPMSLVTACVTAAAPIMLIVAGLTALNLHRVAFDVMGGFREANPENAAFSILFTISLISYLAIIPVLLTYGISAGYRRRGRKSKIAAKRED